MDFLIVPYEQTIEQHINVIIDKLKKVMAGGFCSSKQKHNPTSNLTLPNSSVQDLWILYLEKPEFNEFEMKWSDKLDVFILN